MKKFKGIILAGGVGTRLYPMTTLYSKQLINIYDKPMIYYPLSLLMLVGIRDIIIVADPPTLNMYVKLFGGGDRLGLNIEYVKQPEPKGIAQAFLLSEPSIKDSNVVLILGDNLFYGNSNFLRNPLQTHNIATIFGYQVNNPEDYGVIGFDQYGNPTQLIEKPTNPPSNYAIPGLYIYDSSVVEVTKSIKLSARDELEITDVNQYYLDNHTLHVEKIGRGIAWLDAGTPDSLLETSQFIYSIEKRQGLKIGCIEEIAFKNKFINKMQFENIINNMPNSQYKKYLRNII